MSCIGRVTRRKLVVLFVVLILPATVFAQVREHGSIVVIVYLRDGIVFAADSRKTAAGDSYTDDKCKISAFDDRLLFANVGLDGTWDKSTNSYSWEAATLARNEYLRIKKNKMPQRFSDIVAKKWGQAVKKNRL